MKDLKIIGITLLVIICFCGYKYFTAPRITEELHADYDYVYSFKETTIQNEKIVMFDNSGIENIQYYVVEFRDGEYLAYTYYYMENKEAYLQKYAEVADRIVDYKYSEYMIKTFDGNGYATYDEMLQNIKDYNNGTNLLYVMY